MRIKYVKNNIGNDTDTVILVEWYTVTIPVNIKVRFILEASIMGRGCCCGAVYVAMFFVVELCRASA